MLSIERIDDSFEISTPPFSVMHIEVLGETTPDNNSRPRIAVSSNGHTEAQVFNGISDPEFISYINQNIPDIVILRGDVQNDNFSTDWSKQRIIIYSHHADDIHILELIEKSRFSYLPLKLAAKCGMIRLIESRITFELLQRGFVIPARTRTISKNHEQIRTLEDIVDLDKAGMIISPELVYMKMLRY